jgi:hypothetical protein
MRDLPTEWENENSSTFLMYGYFSNIVCNSFLSKPHRHTKSILGLITFQFNDLGHPLRHAVEQVVEHAQRHSLDLIQHC